ncbi:tryptophan synthase beta subunit-like PLP-dependent enzyme [Apiosordaria backusii]|uniref:Tryptophan synthase beta subunit-like PLP-dependent enzyme n=1 Tax=Apiosordaria backusii TaxID=314023 RepID=A0AA40EBN3_9PEZI|nr:tryptophan synthase beta subunit-like PLP-dependent enzyme [Apiosordaria backusii]
MAPSARPDPDGVVPRLRKMYPCQICSTSPEPCLLWAPPQSTPSLSSHLGGKVNIYAKREDLNSGLAYGGNKTRKLEYLLPEALSQDCDTLVSIGGIQSNHTRQVAACAAHLGLSVSLVQEDWVPGWKDASYEKVGNIQLSRLMGADVNVIKTENFGIGHKDTLRKLMKEVEERGKKPYYIPAGASDHPLGGLGFARWVWELEEQEQQMGVWFGTVVVCAVTGGTLAGIIAGCKYQEVKEGKKKRRVVGIDASARPRETFEQVLRIAKETGRRIGLEEGDITEGDVVLDERFHGGRYGIPDGSTVEAIKLGARLEGFITDPVYEGKSLAGLIGMVEGGEIPEGENVLFAHLGGQVVLNAYGDME